VRTVFGKGLSAYAVEARLGENGAVMREPIAKSQRRSEGGAGTDLQAPSSPMAG
jgi:hypothetical protein